MKKDIKNTNKKGFTLVELMLVMALISIIAGFLLNQGSGIYENTKRISKNRGCSNIVKCELDKAIAYSVISKANGNHATEIYDNYNMSEYNVDYNVETLTITNNSKAVEVFIKEVGQCYTITSKDIIVNTYTGSNASDFKEDVQQYNSCL